jgi:hypothetical protein
MNKGDSVVVIAGTRDPDFDTEIGGWSGRVTETYSDGTLAVEWDSKTLQAMAMDAIQQAESDGLDWSQIVLLQSEVQLAPARDTQADTQAAQKRIRAALK